jgi:hypothetical protein
MADKNAITVEALKAHSYNGREYQVGDTYDFIPNDNPASGISADDQVASLQATGFAARVDRAAVAKAAAKPAAAVAKPAKAPRALKAPRAKKVKK